MYRRIDGEPERTTELRLRSENPPEKRALHNQNTLEPIDVYRLTSESICTVAQPIVSVNWWKSI
jgi:hypothetical protein